MSNLRAHLYFRVCDRSQFGLLLPFSGLLGRKVRLQASIASLQDLQKSVGLELFLIRRIWMSQKLLALRRVQIGSLSGQLLAQSLTVVHLP